MRCLGVDVKPSEAVASAVAQMPGALCVSSLGTATSALRLASDDGPHLYLGGAMGCGLAVALGVADARPDRAVIAVVGDGDLLAGALPGVASAQANSPDEVAVAVRSISRPGIVLARIDESPWPGPSPFVDPPLVRRRFADYAARTEAIS